MSPEFEKWFGKSVVTDPSGKPMPVFHAAKVPHTSFDPKFKTDLSSHGFHFGTADQANFRTSQYDFQSDNPVMGKYFLNIRNPLEVSHMASFAPDHLADQMIGMDLIDEDKFMKIRDRYSDEPSVGRELVKILKKAGYDGLRYANDREGEGFTYVPFDPNQIKSATGNRGTFAPDSDHIGEAEISQRADALLTRILLFEWNDDTFGTYVGLGHNNDKDRVLWVYKPTSRVIDARTVEAGPDTHHEKLWPGKTIGSTYRGRYEPDTGRLSVAFPLRQSERLGNDPTVDDIPTAVYDALKRAFPKITSIETYG